MFLFLTSEHSLISETYQKWIPWKPIINVVICMIASDVFFHLIVEIEICLNAENVVSVKSRFNSTTFLYLFEAKRGI
jgi:hypothetical protein